ncbi:MAG TPA: cytochrome P450 [Bacillales bacterium]|nr:cytochrome P450 [Bacillales bacterium]
MANVEMPRDENVDDTFALLREGYQFIKNRADRLETDVFETRLLGQKAICLSGEKAARLFYDPDLIQRKGAVPKPVQKTLFGEKAIQSLDGDAHLHRKKLFLSLMVPSEQERLAKMTFEQWRARLSDWASAETIVLLEEAKRVLCEASCKWAGVPLEDGETEQRAEDFYAMVDAFGGIGPRHWKGRNARKRTEQWLEQMINEVREGKRKVTEGCALYEWTYFKDVEGKWLDAHMAAVELINVIRPTVAIANYLTFCVLALHEHPESVASLRTGEEAHLDRFVQEVRRYYPFAPFLGARVKKDFQWKGYAFKKGTLVLLDVYGTNRDPHLWEEPNEFRPERFSEWGVGLFEFIPQGGGDRSKTHRCPGEGITVEVMKASVDFLVNEIEYEVPEQDLSYSLQRIPSLPKSGVVMKNVSRKLIPANK